MVGASIVLLGTSRCLAVRVSLVTCARASAVSPRCVWCVGALLGHQVEEVISHLSHPSVRERLLPLLPEGQQTDTHLIEIVSSSAKHTRTRLVLACQCATQVD